MVAARTAKLVCCAGMEINYRVTSASAQRPPCINWTSGATVDIFHHNNIINNDSS